MSPPVDNTPDGWGEREKLKSPWEIAGWSRAGQLVRFHAARRRLRLLCGESVLDFGCATGAFANELPPDVLYHGVDWSRKLLDRAAREHPSCSFSLEMPERRFDHVVAIGTFNVAQGWSLERTREYISELWAVSMKTLLVSLYRGNDPACISYRPEVVAGWASMLSSNWVLDASYRDNDLMMVVRR